MKALLLLGALAAPFAVVAAETPPQRLDPVFVTGTRSPQTQNRLAAAVTTLTREDIERSGASHITELLRGVGVAQVSDLFGDGSRATVDLRGFGEGAHSNALVLVDGRRLNNSDIGSADLNSISLKDVERIEVIQGSAGALYGDQAVGGVINVITRTPAEFGAELEAGAGSDAAWRARASVGGANAGLSYRLSAEQRESDNYREHNALEYRNALGRLGYDYGGGDVFAEAGWVEEDLELPGALLKEEVEQDRRQSTANFQNDFSDTRTQLARLGWNQGFGAWTASTELTHRRTEGQFRLSGIAFTATSDNEQERRITSVNPRVSGGFATRHGTAQLTAGLDLQAAEYVISTSLARQSNDQDTREAYAQFIYPLPGGVDVTLAQRVGRVDNEVFEESFSGFFVPVFTAPTRFHDSVSASQIGFSTQPLESLRLFLRYDGNYRYAKVDELVGSEAAGGSNRVAVKTQTGDSLEFGVDWSEAGKTLRVLAYRLNIEDEIVFDPAGGPFGAGANINLDGTTRDGLALEAGWQALDRLQLSASIHGVDADISAGPLAGNDIPLVAKRSGRLAAQLRLPANLDAVLEVLGTGSRTFAGDFRNALDKLPGHGVANLGLSGQWAGWRLAARVNNLLGKEYSEVGFRTQLFGPPPTFTAVDTPSYFPSPETSYTLSAQYRF